MVTEEELYQKQLRQQGTIIDSQLGREQMAQAQQIKEWEQKDYTLGEAQLEIEKELENLTNLLRGKIPTRNAEGGIEWEDPPNNEEVLLSETGINLVMNTVRFYVNKNTLLSNYDEETINSKMEDIGISISDALFMNYEKYFLYPTEKECQEKLIKRLKKRQESIIYSKKLHKEKYDEEEIWKGLVSEINDEVERQKIREQMIKDKLKGFDLLLRKIQDFIHSAYQRAWKGQERTTLRQHWHISESRAPPYTLPQQTGKGMFQWLKRK